MVGSKPKRRKGSLVHVELDARDYLLFRSSMKKFKVNLPIMTNKMVQALAKYTANGARLRAPKSPGRLAESIDWVSMGNNFSAVTADAYYAAFQEHGFERHRVFVYNKPELYAWMQSKGLTMAPFITVGKQLRDEGYFMGPAYKSTLANFKTIVDPYFKKLMGSFDSMRSR